MQLEKILNIAFYKFVELPRDQLPAWKEQIKHEANKIGVKGSIILSPEGVNAFLAAEKQLIDEFLDNLKSRWDFFKEITIKESWSIEQPFKRVAIKIKPEIITMGRPDLVPSRFTGKRLEPKELLKWYEDKKDFVIVDTRNDYEIAQGTFKNAVDYNIETFKEFPEALQKHKQELKDKTVVMFCTGGIRCEKATALAMEYGIQDVYQLEGGILKYFEDTGGMYYRGDCFVFDGRGNVDGKLTSAKDRITKQNMESLVLHSYRRCPYAIRVRLVLEEKRLPYTVVEENLSNFSPELLKINPHARVPALIHKGVALYESDIITQYLEEMFPHTKLMPESPERRARVRIWTNWVNEIFKPDLDAWKYERVKMTDEEKLKLEDRLIRHLFHLQSGIERRPFLVTKELTLADIHVFPFIRQFLRIGVPVTGQERFAKVWDWVKRIEERPSFAAVMAKPDTSSVA